MHFWISAVVLWLKCCRQPEIKPIWHQYSSSRTSWTDKVTRGPKLETTHSSQRSWTHEPALRPLTLNKTRRSPEKLKQTRQQARAAWRVASVQILPCFSRWCSARGASYRQQTAKYPHEEKAPDWQQQVSQRTGCLSWECVLPEWQTATRTSPGSLLAPEGRGREAEGWSCAGERW